MDTSVRQSIDKFLAARRIAAVGVSRDSRHMSRMLFRDLRTRGYDVVPVNPHTVDIEGVRCYGSISEVDPAADAALLFTTGEATDRVVEQCAESGIRSIWMYRATGRGAVTESAVDRCHQLGISVVPGECPYMFLPHPGWIHSLHGLGRRLIGTYPG